MKKPADKSCVKELTESLVGVAPIFAETEYFMSEDFTLVDCCLAPILWRLGYMGVRLPNSRQARPLLDYIQRICSRPAFRASLSAVEAEMPQPF